MTKRVSQKKPTGGARPGAGRPKTNRRVISARVDDSLYDRIQKLAKKRKKTLSDCVEALLIKCMEGIT
jgi:hypothetical protein